MPRAWACPTAAAMDSAAMPGMAGMSAVPGMTCPSGASGMRWAYRAPQVIVGMDSGMPMDVGMGMDMDIGMDVGSGIGCDGPCAGPGIPAIDIGWARAKRKCRAPWAATWPPAMARSPRRRPAAHQAAVPVTANAASRTGIGMSWPDMAACPTAANATHSAANIAARRVRSGDRAFVMTARSCHWPARARPSGSTGDGGHHPITASSTSAHGR
ncbi:hypothetical protein GCM10022284_59490 [Streptomyces hundungensis]